MKKLLAFTLIELLVTVSVIAVVLALVGPLGLEQLERSRRLADNQRLEKLLEHQQQLAFLRGTKVELDFKGKLLTVRTKNKDPFYVEFSSLFFQSQQVSIDAHGVPSASQIQYSIGNREKFLELHHMVGL